MVSPLGPDPTSPIKKETSASPQPSPVTPDFFDPTQPVKPLDAEKIKSATLHNGSTIERANKITLRVLHNISPTSPSEIKEAVQ